MGDYVSSSLGRLGLGLPRAYKATDVYVKRDLIAYQGNLFVALQDGIIGVPPVSDGIRFVLIVGRGESGESNAVWFTGAAVTGRGTGIVAGVVGSKKGDMYLNSETSDIYGASAPDTWDWSMNMGESVSISAENVPTSAGGTVQGVLDQHAAVLDEHATALIAVTNAEIDALLAT